MALVETKSSTTWEGIIQGTSRVSSGLASRIATTPTFSAPQVTRQGFFDEDGIGAINDGISQCLNVLGDNKSKLDAYFALQELWNDETVSKATGIPLKKGRELLVWYARLELGQKILDCVKKNGRCEFQAET